MAARGLLTALWAQTLTALCLALHAAPPIKTATLNTLRAITEAIPILEPLTGGVLHTGFRLEDRSTGFRLLGETLTPAFTEAIHIGVISIVTVTAFTIPTPTTGGILITALRLRIFSTGGGGSGEADLLNPAGLRHRHTLRRLFSFSGAVCADLHLMKLAVGINDTGIWAEIFTALGLIGEALPPGLTGTIMSTVRIPWITHAAFTALTHMAVTAWILLTI